MSNYQGNDIYCDLIIPKKTGFELVKETKNVIAFYHTKPHWPVHIIVTPKTHVDSLLELSDELALELLTVVKEIAAVVTADFGSCRIITNLGDYQDSKHLHFHISFGKH